VAKTLAEIDLCVFSAEAEGNRKTFSRSFWRDDQNRFLTKNFIKLAPGEPHDKQAMTEKLPP